MHQLKFVGEKSGKKLQDHVIINPGACKITFELVHHDRSKTVKNIIKWR